MATALLFQENCGKKANLNKEHFKEQIDEMKKESDLLDN